MSASPIQFNDGAAYERFMGVWSRKVGEQFLRWLAPVDGMHWLDVGCGNGAFTDLLAQHCAPRALTGIDPSAAQLEFARQLPTLVTATFEVADAMALPFAENSFDAAVMPLVIFFVPEPAQGVAEMMRVVGTGGLVCAYAWDMPGGGFPYAALQTELRALGLMVPTPPSVEASSREAMQAIWLEAGLMEVETTAITVEREFQSFEEYWAIVQGGPSSKVLMESLTPENREQLQQRLRTILPTDAAGVITLTATANAVQGRVPA